MLLVVALGIPATLTVNRDYLKLELLYVYVTRAHHRDEKPERDLTIILPVYLFTTELRHTCSSLLFFK